MSIEEQIEHKKTKMIYLRKLIEREQEEIDRLELQKVVLHLNYIKRLNEHTRINTRR